MKMLKRALLYVIRKRKKNIQLFCILFGMCFLVFLTAAVKKAAEESLRLLRVSLGGYFRIENNEQSAENGYIDEDTISEILKQPEIEDYSGLNVYYISTDDLVLQPGAFTGIDEEKAKVPCFLSNRKTELNESFLTKELTLVKGRHVKADDYGKALISENVAANSGLDIGDTFKAKITTESGRVDSSGIGKEFSFEIVGIYSIKNQKESESSLTAERDMQENFIYTDENVGKEILSAINERERSDYKYGVLFTLKDPKDLKGIVEELKKNISIQWEDYEVIVNEKIYQTSASPLEKVGFMMRVTQWSIFLASGIILTLLFFMWVRDRIREIGIYLSIGIAKRQIFGQLLTEVLLVYVTSICIAAIFSQVILIKFGETFAKSIASLKEIGEASIGFCINLDEMINVFGIGVAIIICAISLSASMIVRLKPRDILTKL